MIPALLAVGALVYLAYKYGQATERVRRAPEVLDLSDDLRRAAARREWSA